MLLNSLALPRSCGVLHFTRMVYNDDGDKVAIGTAPPKITGYILLTLNLIVFVAAGVVVGVFGTCNQLFSVNIVCEFPYMFVRVCVCSVLARHEQDLSWQHARCRGGSVCVLFGICWHVCWP